MESKGHGGKREGAGRKPLSPEESTERHTVTLTASEVQYLREQGGGNISKGIRATIKQAKDK